VTAARSSLLHATPPARMSVLKARAEVEDLPRGLRRVVHGFNALLAHVAQHGRLQPAEREVEFVPFVLDLGERENNRAPVAPSREPVNHRPARIAQPDQLGNFVERLARRVVARAPHELVLLRFGDQEKVRVPARDDERERGVFGRRELERDRVDMAFDVVHAHDRLAERVGEAFGEVDADEERADEARPLRDGEVVNLTCLHAGLGEGCGDDLFDLFEVFARGNFGDDAAEALVRGDLRVDHARAHAPPVFDDRRRRLVARCFNP
jgi:hypothetical protein